MGWEVFEVLSGVHVVPRSDSKPHQCNEYCDCGVYFEKGIYVHNSYDERELTEDLPRS